MPHTVTVIVTTTIPAPVDRVWAVVESTEAQERLEPRARLVSATPGPVAVGSQMELAVRGLRVVCEAVDVEPGLRIRWRQSIRRRVSFQTGELEPLGAEATRVTWTVEQSARWPLVGWTERVVGRELESWLANLAREVSTGGGAGAV